MHGDLRCCCLTRVRTGQSCYSLSTSYFPIGNHQLALHHAREALRIFQIHHPQSHPHVAMTEKFLQTLERPGRPAASYDKNDESRAHGSAAACMLNEGSVVIKRHRGGGFVSTDYAMQFRLGNTFVADVTLMSGPCFYWEIEIIHSFGNRFFGVCTSGFDERIPKSMSVGDSLGEDAWSWSVDGLKHRDGNGSKLHADNFSTFGSSWSDGDVIGFALDMRTAGAAVLSVSVNGSFAAPNGVAFTGIDVPFLSPAFSAFGGLFRLNLGHRPFKHTPPEDTAQSTVSVHLFHHLVTTSVRDISKHRAASQCMRDAGSVVIMCHRGGGCAAADYTLQFQSFNTFVADVKLSGGSFYFEMEVIEIVGGAVQFGCSSAGFEPRKVAGGEGAGDDGSSWGVCGLRQEKWHAGEKFAFGSKWCVGDVIGFALDVRTAGSYAMSVSVNGSFVSPNGLAFSGIDAPFLSPALSGNGRYRVNFGDRPFAHAPPGPEFASVHEFGQAERVDPLQSVNILSVGTVGCCSTDAPAAT